MNSHYCHHLKVETVSHLQSNQQVIEITLREKVAWSEKRAVATHKEVGDQEDQL
jgi:hypothetical protein